MKKKLKNYGLWDAIFAYIPTLIEAFSDYDILITLPSNYAKVTSGILAIFVLLGILNNPSNGVGYKD